VVFGFPTFTLIRNVIQTTKTMKVKSYESMKFPHHYIIYFINKISFLLMLRLLTLVLMKFHIFSSFILIIYYLHAWIGERK